MNTPTSLFRRVAAPLAGVVLLAGCLREHLVWSPDGTRAAVITSDGLHLTDASGKLSPLLLPHAYRAAWLADSQRLVVAHQREIKDYPALTRALGPERTRALTLKAEAVWQQWQSGKPIKDLPEIKPDEDWGGIALYLREHHADRIREKWPADWDKVESISADWHTLSVARLAGDRLEIGATLHAGLTAIAEIRPAPGGHAVAFVTTLELNPTSDDSLQVLLSPIDGAAPARLVARHTSASPDWSADGRTLFVVKGEGERHGGGDLRLGALKYFQVLDADGKISAGTKNGDLAGLIFHDRNRVRALRDGRVLFNAAEFRLPISAKDRHAREEFFVVDPATEIVTRLFPRERLAPLPQSLAHFELSPDEKQILVSDENGKVWLLTVADQRVEPIGDGFAKEDSVAPAWRRPGEFTYRKKIGARAELVQRHGATETVLSRTWPDEVLTQLVK